MNKILIKAALIFRAYKEKFQAPLRALQYRNFRLFMAGQSISLIGTWMQRIALGWLVYRLTGSVLLLGATSFAGQLPTFLLTPLAGVMADRVNRHRLIIFTQAMAMLQALTLSILVLSGYIQIWHIMVLSVVLGMVRAVDMPCRQAFMHEMIDHKANLGNAIALNSSIVNLARLTGPSIAGLLISLTGEGVCFLVNGLSYIAALAALMSMSLKPGRAPKQKRHPIQQLKDGVIYAYSTPPIRAILLLLTLISLMGMPYTVLMPVFTRNILQGGPEALGLLMGAAGVGSLVAAVYLASRSNVLGLEKWMVFTALILALGLMALAFSRNLVLSMLDMSLVGFGMISLMASGNTLLQTIVDDDKRGRVMSFYTFSIMGMAPFGSLFYGTLAKYLGVPFTLATGGIACFAGSLVFYLGLPFMRKHIHPIYVKLGILPEIASGLESATEITAYDKNLD